MWLVTLCPVPSYGVVALVGLYKCNDSMYGQRFPA